MQLRDYQKQALTEIKEKFELNYRRLKFAGPFLMSGKLP